MNRRGISHIEGHSANRLVLDEDCRVCGSIDLQVLPLGEYAAFFRLRVDTSKDPYLLFSRSPLIGSRPQSHSIPARAYRKLKRILPPAKPRPRSEFRTYVQRCSSCHTVTPCHEWLYQDLLGLYRDYRLASYNRDRISVEPGYGRIAELVGSDPREITARNSAVGAFLRRNAALFIVGPMIDYGGSDGRFLPQFVFEHSSEIDVFDASDAPLHGSVDPTKVKKVAVARQGVYAFLTCMHVLEHVGNPRSFFLDAAACVRPGGLLYIEVPLESNEETSSNFALRMMDQAVSIHEHINLYDTSGIPGLINSINGMELIDQQDDVIDIGWSRARVGRYLIRKNARPTDIVEKLCG